MIYEMTESIFLRPGDAIKIEHGVVMEETAVSGVWRVIGMVKGNNAPSINKGETK
jgi:hypothetical protein